MMKFLDFFNCGTVVNDGPTKKQFRIRDFKKLETTLFPFLDSYPLQTQKALDAKDFRLVHSMMKDKLHLTEDGLNTIRSIASAMNRGRMEEYAHLKSPHCYLLHIWYVLRYSPILYESSGRIERNSLAANYGPASIE